MALIGLAGTALFVGTPTTLAQGPYTEVIGVPAEAIGAPGGGSFQVSGGYGESGLNTVHVDDGGPGLSTAGGYAVPVGPGCMVNVMGSGRGRHEVANSGCEGGMVFSSEAPIYP